MAPIALQKIAEELATPELADSSLVNGTVASCVALSAGYAGFCSLPGPVKRAALPLGLAAAAITFKLNSNTHHAAKPETSSSGDP